MKLALTQTCSFASPKLVAAVAPGKGRAVFSQQPIAAGELLAVWGGTIIALAEAYELARHERAQCIQIEDELVLWTAQNDESLADWINHSCNPNAGMLGQIGPIAMRDIKQGEEICFDYAMSSNCDLDEFACCCGHQACRGFVSGQDWRRHDLQQRYGGFFSPFIERSLRRSSPHDVSPSNGATLSDGPVEEPSHVLASKTEYTLKSTG
jgi:hypothetical protein